MKPFMTKDFFLHGETAKRLYHEYAKDMPIFDYHNHLDPREIFERRRFSNITQVWLEGDHYKWRGMRALGIEEQYITGDADDFEKFLKWAYTIERLPGNPLYQWTHLELQCYFGISEPLGVANAERIWEICNAQLAHEGFDAVGLLERMRVTALCTTDEPADSLEWHQKIEQSGDVPFRVLPTFRPDQYLHIEDSGFLAGIKLLEHRYDTTIQTLDALKDTLARALDFFQTTGCLLSDHGFSRFVYGQGSRAADAFRKAQGGQVLTEEEVADFKGEMLRFLGAEYHRRGLAMQLHLGAIRNNNSLMVKKLGPNSGYDSVGPTTDPFLLAAFLDDLEVNNSLPKTILYCLNSNDITMFSTMALNFAASGLPGKVQLGSAWWFEDHARGITRQIDELLETGLISVSVGMLTDSRSLTSFVRHDYYRRILCNRLGSIVDSGAYPADFIFLGALVRDVCYYNAVHFLGLNNKGDMNETE